MTRQRFAGWGGTPASWAHAHSPRDTADLVSDVVRQPGRLIARGLGRCYGDAAQCAGGTVITLENLNHIAGLERNDGVITCQAGVVLADLINAAAPRGWFIPVTPGTSQVTIGGAIAADIHGKNHHNAGSFGDHLVSVDLLNVDGQIRTLLPGTPEFRATVGGMGLTGVIVAATLRMLPIASSTMSVSTRRTSDFDATVEVLKQADASRYSVAWLDILATGNSLGRGVVTFGDHTSESGGQREMRLAAPRIGAPSWLPSGMLNRGTMAAFNSAWYLRAPRKRDDETQSIREFFYPLDAVRDWNRVYGPRGFVQYQFVVPEPDVLSLRAIVELFVRHRVPSFLTVLKRFGPGNDAYLSFPTSGWTLAVDIPAAFESLADILRAADERVVAAGGRIYLAKDSRLAPRLLPQMYPQLDEFRAVREAMDPQHRFASDLARRLDLV